MYKAQIETVSVSVWIQRFDIIVSRLPLQAIACTSYSRLAASSPALLEHSVNSQERT